MNVLTGSRCAPRKPSGGFTIIELLLVVVLGLVLSAAAVDFSANMFSSNTKSIMMIQMSEEMRSAMQLISRDIRRSGYNGDALGRFLATETIGSGITLGPLDEYDNATCLEVNYENLQGDPVNAVYRMRTVDDIGRVAANFDADASCETDLDDNGWVDLTDSTLIDVRSVRFKHEANFTDIAENSSTGNVVQVEVEAINITISARLKEDETVSRGITDTVQLKNQSITV